MTTLSDKMTELADACRKRFVVTSKLNIDDMIKLITPPAFPSGTEILGRTRVGIVQSSDIPLTLEAVPPAMSKPIELSITASFDNWLKLTNAKLIFKKSDGKQLVLTIPNIDTNYSGGAHWVRTVSVTIPANTSIISNKAILRINDYNSFEIEKIIATY